MSEGIALSTIRLRWQLTRVLICSEPVALATCVKGEQVGAEVKNVTRRDSHTWPRAGEETSRKSR